MSNDPCWPHQREIDRCQATSRPSGKRCHRESLPKGDYCALHTLDDAPTETVEQETRFFGNDVTDDMPDALRHHPEHPGSETVEHGEDDCPRCGLPFLECSRSGCPAREHGEDDIVERDDEGRPYPCGAFVSGDSRWYCRLESDHEGDHEWVQRHSPEEPEIPRHVHRALALVEQSLESEERCKAVMRQTGGNAPELVQGILDGIVRLYRRSSTPGETPTGGES